LSRSSAVAMILGVSCPLATWMATSIEPCDARGLQLQLVTSGSSGGCRGLESLVRGEKLSAICSLDRAADSFAIGTSSYSRNGCGRSAPELSAARSHSCRYDRCDGHHCNTDCAVDGRGWRLGDLNRPRLALDSRARERISGLPRARPSWGISHVVPSMWRPIGTPHFSSSRWAPFPSQRLATDWPSPSIHL
jgi:hypothetical protein